MPGGEELLCAVRDAQSDTEVVRIGADLAAMLGLRLVIVHVREASARPRAIRADADAVVDELRELAAAHGAPQATVRVHDGAVLAVLKGLGRALASAWLVIGAGRKDGGAGTIGALASALVEASGCPLLVVGRAEAAPLAGSPAVVCVVDSDFATRNCVLAARLAHALAGHVIVLHPIPAGAATDNPRPRAQSLLTRCAEVIEREGVGVSSSLVPGDRLDSVLATVESHKPRALVIAGHPRDDVAIPPTSELAGRVLAHAHELLVVRQSPVGARVRQTSLKVG